MAAPSDPQNPPPSGEANPWLIAFAVILATFMEVLDTSISAVALPYIAGSLGATNDEATWVLTSYLVANAVVLPASGWLSLRFGRKRFFITCIVIFTVASFFTGAANSLATIVLARAIQGAGGGALQPLTQAILLESFPPERRGAAMAIFGLGVVVAPVVGPTLGGYLTDTYSWRWAYYINIPVGALAVLLIGRFVHDPHYIRNARVGKLDWIGLVLLLAWLGALQMILDKGQEDDWFGATWIRWAAAVVVVGLIGFIARELLAKQPLVDLRVLGNRNYAIGCLLIAIFGVMIYGVVTILPLFYQTLLGYDALAAGFAVAPRGLGAIAALPIIALLTNRIDNRWLLVIGFGGFGITSHLFGQLTLQISPTSLFWPIFFSGMATGFIFVPVATVALGTLHNEQIGNATGLFNLLRNVGGSIGIATLNSLVAHRSQIHRNYMVKWVTPGRPVFERTFRVLEALMARTVGPGTSTRRALALIERTVDQQAAYWSYVDDFRYLVVGCVLCIPLVFLLQRVKPKKGAAPVGH